MTPRYRPAAPYSTPTARGRAQSRARIRLAALREAQFPSPDCPSDCLSRRTRAPRIGDPPRPRVVHIPPALSLSLLLLFLLITLAIGYVREARPEPLVLESTLEPAVSVQVHAQESGAVSEVRVAVGDPVSPGDTLACLDPRSWQLQAEIAGLDLAQAYSRLRRVQPLYTQGGLSAQDLEQLEHQVRLAELRQQEADLALTAAVLLSPLAGVVAAVAVEPGQHVVTGQPCLLVIDPRDLQAQLYIPVDDYHQVRRGQTVIAEYQPDPADDPALPQPAVADQIPADVAGPSPSPRAAAGVPAGPSSSPRSSPRSSLLPLRGRLIRLAPTAEPGTDQCLAVARFPEAGRHYPPGIHVRITLSQE